MSHPFTNPRRIVAGMRDDGASYFARVEEVREVDYEHNYPSLAGRQPKLTQIYRIYASDHLPIELPQDGLRAPLLGEPSADDTHTALRRSSAHPPEADGFRISMIVMHPDPDGAPGRLHWHDTFDCQWLVSGQLAVSMDDGSEVVMNPGDALLQYGTNHAWRVVGSEPAVLYLFMTGARRVGQSPPAEHEMVSRPA
ncbi:MAG TPA: hypothetical protein VNQ73_03795 [Ilumatobacter sp.]|nr:hypothetical protein [Ilumatobacter sp.]